MPPTTILLATGGVATVIAAIWLAYRLGARRAQAVAAELASLNEISRQLLRSRLSVDELCELLYWHISRLIPSSLFQLGLFDGDIYQIKVWVRDGQRLENRDFPQGGTRGIVGWVRKTGNPLLIRDFEAERSQLPAFPEFELEAPPRSGLFIPLIAGESTIGLVAVQSYQVGRFTHEHLRMLTALANQAAWAIRNAQLYEDAHYRAEQLNLIGQVSAQISAVQPLPDLFHQLVTLIKETFGYYCVSILVREGDKLIVGESSDNVLPRSTVYEGPGMIGWAAEKGQTALANDVAQDPRYQKAAVLPETRSEIALPLKVESRVLGVLDVQSNRLHAFRREEVFLLETLASQITLAIEQARVYDAQYRTAQRLEALTQVTRAVVSVLDLEDLLDEVVDLIADTFEFEQVHIYVLSGERLIYQAGSGSKDTGWSIGERAYSLSEIGLIPEVARTGEAVLVTGTEGRATSQLVIPIKMAERVLGVIDICSGRPNAFSEDDLALMRSLADSVAVAIRNATLYITERRRRKLADTLRDISVTLTSDLSLDEVLARILERLADVVELDTAAILLFDEDFGELTVMATLGAKAQGIKGHRLPLSKLSAEDEADLEDAVFRAYHRLLSMPEDHSCLTAPLMVANDLIGYLIVDHHASDHYSDEAEVVRAFANQAAVAIHNARLYTAQQSEAWVTTALLQVAEAINTQIEVGDALEMIARLTALLVGVRYCLVLRWEAEERAYYLSAQYGIPHNRYAATLDSPIQVGDDPFLTLMSLADQPLGAGEGHPLAIPAVLAEILTTPSILGFPLQAKKEMVGLLVVDDPHPGLPLDPRKEAILTGIAHQAATALDAAALQARATERDLLERELAVARSIQASFIPDAPPQEPGWEMAAGWWAARQVSGDFYDFIPLRDGRWGLVIADVADKGIPAALFMAMCRTLLRAVAITHISPATTLRRVNDLLFNDSRSDLFVTVFYAVWDPATGQVDYASAGHNPAILVRSSNHKLVELRSPGIALGVMPDISVEEHRLTLKPGDVLIAYTDGVTEAMQADFSEWGMERFKVSIESVMGKSAQDMLDGIIEAVDEFVGGAPQSDDFTIWLLRRKQSEDEKKR